MTASDKSKVPDFFSETDVDPVITATGAVSEKQKVKKKKAGFYLSEDVLDRFNRKFYQLKLDGTSIENKSKFLEMVICYALDEMDKDILDWLGMHQR